MKYHDDETDYYSTTVTPNGLVTKAAGLGIDSSSGHFPNSGKKIPQSGYMQDPRGGK